MIGDKDAALVGPESLSTLEQNVISSCLLIWLIFVAG
jgi:hypothetical protein